jgi:hypothetical protein
VKARMQNVTRGSGTGGFRSELRYDHVQPSRRPEG